MKGKQNYVGKIMKNVAIGTVIILLIPLIAMQFTAEVMWTLSDFIVIAALLLGTGLIYALVTKNVQKSSKRLIIGIVLVVIMLVIWVDLAVGIFNLPFSGS